MARKPKENTSIKLSFNFEYPKNIDKRLRALKSKQPEYWLNLGKKQVDKLIKFTIRTTPAYRKFLKDNGVDYKKINGFEDFSKLPVMDKNNYLRKYDYLSLFPYNDLYKTKISATSGSSGEPFYFPRSDVHDLKHIYTFEIFLKNQFEIDKRKSLVIIGFGLGIWIGGIINFKTFEFLSKKYKISIIPIGVNKDLILKSINKYHEYFDQIILIGYPPFIKDIADEIKNNKKIFQKKLKFRIINAAEGFPEELREYFASSFKFENMFNDNTNIYGTIELNAMANETAFSNLIRHLAVEKDKVFKNIFREAKRTPTLAQYHPYIVWFEEKDGLILGTGYGNSIPLIKYSFPDIGGVIYFDDMIKRLKEVGVNIFKEAEKFKIKDKILKLPFVYVYERSDFAVSLVGINIYPEYIKKALLKSATQRYVTGKFSMQIIYSKSMNQKLEIHIELKKNIKPSKQIEQLIQKEVTKSLKEHSAEYNHLYSSGNTKYKKQIEPNIILHLYEDQRYFKTGIKQKWAIK